jgi:hypothetical protein
MVVTVEEGPGTTVLINAQMENGDFPQQVCDKVPFVECKILRVPYMNNM